MAKSSTIKRSVVIAGHATSVSLELEFWELLKEMAVADSVSVAAFIRKIDENLTSPPPSKPFKRDSRRHLKAAPRT